MKSRTYLPVSNRPNEVRGRRADQHDGDVGEASGPAAGAVGVGRVVRVHAVDSWECEEKGRVELDAADTLSLPRFSLGDEWAGHDGRAPRCWIRGRWAGGGETGEEPTLRTQSCGGADDFRTVRRWSELPRRVWQCCR